VLYVGFINTLIEAMKRKAKAFGGDTQVFEGDEGGGRRWHRALGSFIRIQMRSRSVIGALLRRVRLVGATIGTDIKGTRENFQIINDIRKEKPVKISD
jgi:hypothetical protein